MRLLILDASVAVKWYLPRSGEELVEEAFELLNSHRQNLVEFITVDLFWAEFGNVLWKAVQHARLSAESAVEAVRQMREWRVPTVPASELLDKALEIAFATRRPVYDSLYISLAVRAGGELVTADERLANAIATRFPVAWLGLL